VFDLPLFFDPGLDQLQSCPNHPLPFESAVSPAILSAIFRHVWGFVGGVHSFFSTEMSGSVTPVCSAVSDYKDSAEVSEDPLSFDDDESTNAPQEEDIIEDLALNIMNDDNSSIPPLAQREDSTTDSLDLDTVSTNGDAGSLPPLIQRDDSTVCSWDLESDDDI
jgi:hypothetical protein